jgi:hypothetical protein
LNGIVRALGLPKQLQVSYYRETSQDG